MSTRKTKREPSVWAVEWCPGRVWKPIESRANYNETCESMRELRLNCPDDRFRIAEYVRRPNKPARKRAARKPKRIDPSTELDIRLHALKQAFPLPQPARKRAAKRSKP